MTILLRGLNRDQPMAAVLAQLRRLGAPVHFLDQRRVLDTTVRVDAGPFSRTVVTVADDEFDLEQVRAAYLRPHDSTQLPALRAVPASSAEWRHAADVDQVLNAWSDRTAAYVLNRPEAAAGNASKPFQLRAIAATGFFVPTTLVTNDPEQVEAFVREHGDVIVKSTSGVRSRVRRVRPGDAARFAPMCGCTSSARRCSPPRSTATPTTTATPGRSGVATPS